MPMCRGIPGCRAELRFATVDYGGRLLAYYVNRGEPVVRCLVPLLNRWRIAPERFALEDASLVYTECDDLLFTLSLSLRSSSHFRKSNLSMFCNPLNLFICYLGLILPSPI
eukprot:TRINITY_DN16198_c0_g1_i2.p2 TRINITY_DN16198_c0_g1~~TRINITY_DN16198_c0_g1_i2.p2  ORF type:complete len:111 (+),score=13.37 TRINITY_DN16198_c0_g1_i2:120-452(+)